jgi:penicillin amidase
VDAPLPASASNAWTVAGWRSASGAPLLASDPHLGYGAPVLWYLARMELADGRMLAGATAPGTPLMIIGRNADLAWGFTTTHSDTQDIFIETEDAVRRTRTEIIAVRGAEPVTLVVRETANGPVISDLDETPRQDGRLLSVRMANLEPNDSSARGILMLNRAQDIAEARAAAALIASPPQNLMVADRAGGIAMYLTGRTPIRAEGDGSHVDGVGSPLAAQRDGLPVLVEGSDEAQVEVEVPGLCGQVERLERATALLVHHTEHLDELQVFALLGC